LAALEKARGTFVTVLLFSIIGRWVSIQDVLDPCKEGATGSILLVVDDTYLSLC